MAQVNGCEWEFPISALLSRVQLFTNLLIFNFSHRPSIFPGIWYLLPLYTWPLCTWHVLTADWTRQCHWCLHHNIPAVCRLKWVLIITGSLNWCENENPGVPILMGVHIFMTLVCANLCYRTLWCLKCIRMFAAMYICSSTIHTNCETNLQSLCRNFTGWAVTWRTSQNHKTVISELSFSFR